MMAPVTMSLIFRLFDDEKLRMRSITVVMIVGMSGFVLGPLLGGTALAHVSWEWLLVVNAPIALIAWIGVRLGVPADRAEDLTTDPLDLPGTRPHRRPASASAATRSPAGSRTAGSRSSPSPRRWARSRPSSPSCATSAAPRSRCSTSALFSSGPARGAAITQMGASITMASVMFGLILHFQYAYGWSPVRAGLANLPLIVTMIAATPVSEWLAARFGHRVACLVGTGLLVTSLLGMAWSVEHGYLAIAVVDGRADRRACARS